MNGHYVSGLSFLTIEINHEEVEFLVDTGFNGALLLSLKKINELNLKRIGFAQYTTADGAIIDAEIFSIEIEWFSKKKQVSVIASQSDFSLLGMELLRNTKIILEPSKEILIIEQAK